jgi:hypothetical protein
MALENAVLTIEFQLRPAAASSRKLTVAMTSIVAANYRTVVG